MYLRIPTVFPSPSSNLLSLGLFTDGDLRRLVAEESAGLDQNIEEIMTRNPLHLNPDDRALDAEAVLSLKSIDQAPVLDRTNKLVGLIDIQDLARTRDAT